MSYPRPSPPFTRLHVVGWTSVVVDEQGSSKTRPDATHDCEEAA